MAELRQALDDTFDHALLRHGFMHHNRDYQLVIQPLVTPRAETVNLRYVFRHCVQATCVTALPPHTWAVSLDDRLTTDEPGELDGHYWGVNWQMLYPGATLITDSPAARHWTEAVGIDFHEVRIETNVHDLTLIFSDLQISHIAHHDN
ncbi:hypothetical protein [Nonomuraea sp. NPDC049725]|uniref:YxiG-like protein n=1 Tax=Nonomuraea sp. NPDC049725 TaxID=3154508 RepID=UPI0034176F18